ncbi:MAG: 4Fe-4S dicluster domain-containing protein [Rhodospirillales bacterium]|nr:4Fe-4S dicluster domain-containing protein [Rhodospirillales bacterium]
MRRPKPEYHPPEEQRRLFPDITGNDLNGRGEEALRRPSPIYWHYGSDIKLPHRALQDYYMKQFEDKPELHDFDKKYGGRGARQHVDRPDVPVEASPERWAETIKAHALSHEGDLVGIARIDPNWVFEGYEVDLPWIVMIGVAMDHAEISTAPELPSAVETMAQYNRGTRAARHVADFIQAQGYEARPHGGPMAGPMTLIPAAIQAGLGELGKHGSMINREYGSSFRLAGVMTDLPLIADAPDDFGADDFCVSCQVCRNACPPDAIFDEKQMVRGERKWFVDFDKCIPFFNDTQGCGICIAKCPWSRPGVARSLAQRMTARRARIASGEHGDHD